MSAPDSNNPNNPNRPDRIDLSDRVDRITLMGPAPCPDVDGSEGRGVPENEPDRADAIVPAPIEPDWPTFDDGSPLETAAVPPPAAADEDVLQQRIKTRDLCLATRQLATLLKAGMPLVPALSALVEQLRSVKRNRRRGTLARVFAQITGRVNAGDSLAHALRDYPRIFSPLYINLVRAGQVGGNLEEVLIKLAELLERRARLAARVRAALAYPALMALAAVAVIIFLMTFVVPGLTAIFLEMNQTLPLPTRLLIAVSDWLRGSWLLLALALALVALLGSMYLKTPTARMAWDRFKLRLPLLGEFFLMVETIRFTRTLGSLLAGGIPLLDALALVRNIVQNRYLAEGLDRVREDIARGHTVAHALRKIGLFPPLMIHAVAIGEMSGNVEQQLNQLADDYEDQLQLTVQSLTSLLEPAVLLVMGVIVGFIVLATLLPIFEINRML